MDRPSPKHIGTLRKVIHIEVFDYEGDNGIDISISGGSSIIYRGSQKQDFMEKVLTIKMK